VTSPRANHRHQALSRAVPRKEARSGTGERSLARDRVVCENWVGRGRPSVLYAVIVALKLTMLFPSEPRDLLPAAYPFVVGGWNGCRLVKLVGRIAHGGGSGAVNGVRGMLTTL
jgi:hypothetical protein